MLIGRAQPLREERVLEQADRLVGGERHRRQRGAERRGAEGGDDRVDGQRAVSPARFRGRDDRDLAPRVVARVDGVRVDGVRVEAEHDLRRQLTERREAQPTAVVERRPRSAAHDHRVGGFHGFALTPRAGGLEQRQERRSAPRAVGGELEVAEVGRATRRGGRQPHRADGEGHQPCDRSGLDLAGLDLPGLDLPGLAERGEDQPVGRERGERLRLVGDQPLDRCGVAVRLDDRPPGGERLLVQEADIAFFPGQSR